ncbi:MAG: hypothetical protein NZ108_05785, partial [Bacteroidia bacterium]|nr:hypothetical protein [Bacteroidia bacterium]
HQNFQNKCYGGIRIRHNNYQTKCYAQARVKHYSYQTKCYQSFYMKHKPMKYYNKCYPTFAIRHRNYQSKTCAKLSIQHRDLSNKCYARLQIKHQNYQTKCYARLQIKHRDFSNKCYARLQIKHRSLHNVCYARLQVKHKSFDGFTCGRVLIKHVPLHKYKVYCDPNIKQPETNMERIGKEIKILFTRHKKFCKLNDIHSGVAVGNVIETSKYDKAIVKDYIVQKKILRYKRYPNGDSTMTCTKEKEIRAVKHIIVEVPRSKDKYRTSNGNPALKKVKLSRAETKTIMMRELVERNKLNWLVRIYPEERQNLKAIIAQFEQEKKDKQAKSTSP